VQTFTAPITTTYKIECWGASGGNSYNDNEHPEYTNTVYGGKGGYCSGIVTFPSNLNIYVYIGLSGEGSLEQTFNGGGSAGARYNGRSGGGATDVRLTEGNTWREFSSLKSRIIVAAGGGGAHHYFYGNNGGYAGGLFGQDGFKSGHNVVNEQLYTIATGAIQTSGGKGGVDNQQGYRHGGNGFFGVGGIANNYGHGGGGGSGYYGGGGGGNADDNVGSGAGGSSFISGYTGCNAIAESSTEDNIIHTGQPNHYSGYIFTNSVMIDGGSVMPSPTGGTETGHEGNGYCIITWQQLPQ